MEGDRVPDKLLAMVVPATFTTFLQERARGIAPVDKVIGRLPADPTFEEIEAAGGLVETHAEGHAVANSTVWVSGEIPRVTSFEAGLPGGVRWMSADGGDRWVKEEVHIIDSVVVIELTLGVIGDYGREIRSHRCRR